ncbi:MAG: TonB-dependent receptor, partial [Steroidobacteraceae bacterium]
MASTPSFAQETSGESMEIVVTGSRIRQETGMTTPVPVTTVSTDELLTLNPGAALTDQLSRMPQLVSTESAQRSSGALFGNAGGSYINLRGLESKRTLVLLDGSRIVPNDRGGVVNIGTLPTGLIKSVDIVTGGASAQYGADAVGGVVNFVLDRNFKGLKLNSSTGITEVGDGWNIKGSIATGFSVGEKLHVIASAEALSIDQIMRDPEKLDDDWFKRWGHVTNPAWLALPAAQRATSGVPQRLTLPYVISATHSPTGVLTSPNANFAFNRYTFTDDGSNVRPFRNGTVTSISGTGSTQSMAGSPEFDAANAAFQGGPYGAQVKERSAFVGFKYDLTDRVQLISQALLGISESNQPDQRGLPHLQDTWFATIYQDNAFLPAGVRAEMQRL